MTTPAFSGGGRRGAPTPSSLSWTTRAGPPTSGALGWPPTNKIWGASHGAAPLSPPRRSCCRLERQRGCGRHRTRTVSGTEGTRLQVARAPTTAAPVAAAVAAVAAAAATTAAAPRCLGQLASFRLPTASGGEPDEPGHGRRADRAARGGARRSLSKRATSEACDGSCWKRQGGKAVRASQRTCSAEGWNEGGGGWRSGVRTDGVSRTACKSAGQRVIQIRRDFADHSTAPPAWLVIGRPSRPLRMAREDAG